MKEIRYFAGHRSFDKLSEAKKYCEKNDFSTDLIEVEICGNTYKANVN